VRAVSPDLLAAALAHAARGWRVFPLRPDDKRPAVADWENRATADPDRVTRCWSAGPYGVGVACGPSGLLVIDLDVPKAGQDTSGAADGRSVFAAVCDREEHPIPADTYTVATGSGGTHLYYRQPPPGPYGQLRNTAGRIGPLVDTRGAGGYVVAAGSTVAGRPYRVLLDRDPAPLPGWLHTLLLPPRPAGPPPAGPLTLGPGRAAAYLAAAIDDEARRVSSAPPGEHNKTLYTAAMLLGQFVAGGALDEPTVRTALLTATWLRKVTAGCDCTEREADKTITSGLRAGACRPRTVAA
jgi:hypothetical protein